MKSKLSVILPAMVLAMSLAACGQASGSADGTAAESAAAESAAEETSAESSTEAETEAVTEPATTEAAGPFEPEESFYKDYEEGDYYRCTAADTAESMEGTKIWIRGAEVLSYTSYDEKIDKYYNITGVQDEDGNIWKVIGNVGDKDGKVAAEAYDYDVNGIFVRGTCMGLDDGTPMLIADEWFTVADGVLVYSDGVAASSYRVADVADGSAASGNEAADAKSESAGADSGDAKSESTAAASGDSTAKDGDSKSETRSADETTVSESVTKALEEYEDFFDEYVSFMKDYDSDDKSQAIKYIAYASKYSETMNSFEALGKSDLNKAEKEAYTEAKKSIDEKLAEVKK